MKILAFDSSSKALAVAITEDGQLLAETRLNLKKNHSTTLMTTIDFLMEQIDLKPTELDRIAVAEGPGSYTGLRLAATVAKTLAWTLNKELIGISSLLAIAGNLTSDKLIVPVLDARRGNAYAAAYQHNAVLIEDQHCLFSDFLTKLTEKEEVLFTGETANFREQILAAGFAEKQILTDSAQILPSAYAIARLAEKLDPIENIHAFAPKYLKKVEAEENWLKAQKDKHETHQTNQDYVQRV